MAAMRSPFFRLLTLVLALLVGAQSMAWAIGARCSKTKMSASEAVGDLQHDMKTMGAHVMASMDHGPVLHEGHAAHMEAATDGANLGGLICKCGPGCVMASCVGSGAGIINLAVSGSIQVAPPTLERFDLELALRAAHDLELIRPPSKS